MVGVVRVVHVVLEFPVEAGDVAGDPGEELEAALGCRVRAVTGVLRDPYLPTPREGNLKPFLKQGKHCQAPAVTRS